MKRLVWMFICLGLVPMVDAQQMRIVVLDAHHGKPVAFECLNVSVGAWHGTDILARTNKDGVVTIDITQDHVTAELVPAKPCLDFPTSKAIAISDQPLRLSVLPDWYVSCQYSSKQFKDPVWLAKSAQDRTPLYSVKEVLSEGTVADNFCSKFAPKRNPGDLIIVVRKRTLWEGMRS